MEERLVDPPWFESASPIFWIGWPSRMSGMDQLSVFSWFGEMLASKREILEDL